MSTLYILSLSACSMFIHVHNVYIVMLCNNHRKRWWRYISWNSIYYASRTHAVNESCSDRRCRFSVLFPLLAIWWLLHKYLARITLDIVFQWDMKFDLKPLYFSVIILFNYYNTMRYLNMISFIMYNFKYNYFFDIWYINSICVMLYCLFCNAHMHFFSI